jgi:hypothetical protein
MSDRHTQDFFDITFCYFPITFRPPPDDPYGISADDLKQSLRCREILCIIIFSLLICYHRLCLCATPALGPLGIPVFLEKLTAGSPATKVTVLPFHEVVIAGLTPRLTARNSTCHVQLSSGLWTCCVPWIREEDMDLSETWSKIPVFYFSNISLRGVRSSSRLIQPPNNQPLIHCRSL